MQELAKVPLTVKALLGRINRKLARQQQVVKKARSLYVAGECGAYYLLDCHRHLIVATHVKLAELGQELGCVYDYEQVQVDDQVAARPA